jgi:hypothetical protein
VIASRIPVNATAQGILPEPLGFSRPGAWPLPPAWYHRIQSVDQDKNLDLQIQECLKQLGISSAVDWDVLAFVCRHQASLASAEQMARLLGYPSTVVGDALDHLESLKLIRRSRASQGVRLYQFGSPELDAASQGCVRQLITIAENPTGRSLLIKSLSPHRTGLSLARKKDGNG